MPDQSRNSGTSLWDFLRAFGANWLTLMSGPLTVPFAIAALLVPGLYRLLFATLAVASGVGSSYVVWRNERERAVLSERRGLPQCSPDKLQEVEDQYRTLTVEQQVAVRKILLAGRMTIQQMSAYLQDVARFPGAGDVLPLIELKTTLIKRDYIGYYEITPAMKDALEAYLEDKEKTSGPIP
jgi:hypothetical protein